MYLAPSSPCPFPYRHITITNLVKARDRVSIDALLRSNQKEAAEALLSPKQTTVSFDTSDAPLTRLTTFACRFPTPRANSHCRFL
jgi:hypothetical protein